MNTNNLYLLGIVLCVSLVIMLFIELFSSKQSKKQKVLIFIGIVLGIGISTFSYIKHRATYKEAYYLKYTIYYPGNTCTYEVDSCNHVYISSHHGTNGIGYYSIPDKEFYSTYTSAPIVINKIIKK